MAARRQSHRDIYPAVTEYDSETQVIIRLAWYQHGELHRDGDAPADIEFDRQTRVAKAERWYQHGHTHRDNGPAEIYRASDGSLVSEQWLQHDGFHRVDAPAIIDYYQRGPKKGQVRSVSYWEHGKPVRPPRALRPSSPLRRVGHSLDIG